MKITCISQNFAVSILPHRTLHEWNSTTGQWNLGSKSKVRQNEFDRCHERGSACALRIEQTAEQREI